MKSKHQKKQVSFIWRIFQTLAWIWLGLALFVCAAFILGLAAMSSFRYSDSYSGHEYFIGAINRSQQAYFWENREFASQLQSFDFGRDHIEEQTVHYKYIIEAEENFAFVYSIPKQKYGVRKIMGINLGANKNQPFYSYVGAVYAIASNSKNSSELKMDTIICQNNFIGIKKLPKPSLKAEKLVCAGQTQEFLGRGE